MKSLVVVGRRWFDRKNGNTYHTSQIIVNGVSLHKTEVQYGYEDAYIESASAWLEYEGHLIIRRHNNVYSNRLPLWQYCRENSISLTTTAVDVARKKDL